MSSSDKILERIRLINTYDWRSLPARVSSSLRLNINSLCWFDGDRFFYGLGGDFGYESFGQKTFQEIEHLLPEPIYRDKDLFFYKIEKPIKHGNILISNQTLDTGYIEFLIDIVSGTLATYKGNEGVELWRRYRRVVDRITEIDEFYGIPASKRVRGVMDVCFNIITSIEGVIEKTVTSGLCIGNKVYSPIEVLDLTDEIIPKKIIDDCGLDLEKAGKYFKLICPDYFSRHNLLLATVYPYFKRSSEKFFILKGTGGNGKSQYMRHFETIMGSMFDAVDFVNMSSTGFTRESAIQSLRGKMVLQAPEENLDNPKFTSELKKVATADLFKGRSIGGNSETFRPEGTLFIDTNKNVDIGKEDAITRRQVGIWFNKKNLGRSFNDFWGWSSTVQGASSLFVYAWSYFVEERNSKFDWEYINVSNSVALEYENTVKMVMFETMEEEISEVLIRVAQLDGIKADAKKELMIKYGLKEIVTKRNCEKNYRALVVDDEWTWNLMCEEYGFRRKADNEGVG